MAGCTPLRRWKRETHEGGITDPCIVHWPKGITTPGGIRDQFAHAIDVTPTILDVLGLEPPATIDGVEQRPLDGTSFAYTFADPDAAPRHTTQYFEMLGCRAIYDNGWKAVTFKPMGHMYREEDDPDLPFDQDEWELFHTAEDFSESHNLAAEQPEKLAELQALWWAEAERNHVLPLDNRAGIAMMEPPPTGIPPRTRYVYRPGGHMVPEFVAVDVKRRSHRIAAEVEIPAVDIAAGESDGVLVAMGAILGGYSLFVANGRLHYIHNHVGRKETLIAAPDPLTPGPHTLEFAYRCDDPWAGGLGTLLVDGETVAEGEIKRFTAVKWSLVGAGLTCGFDGPSAVTPRYKTPNRFRGTLHQVAIEVAPVGPHADGWEDLQAARMADLKAGAALAAD